MHTFTPPSVSSAHLAPSATPHPDSVRSGTTSSVGPHQHSAHRARSLSIGRTLSSSARTVTAATPGGSRSSAGKHHSHHMGSAAAATSSGGAASGATGTAEAAASAPASGGASIPASAHTPEPGLVSGLTMPVLEALHL
jgi:hypothetical protein